MSSVLLGSLILGLLGGFHCVGMCGPIAIIVHQQGSNRVWSSIQYNVGRAITYGIMGALVGLLGQSINFSSFQKTASIVVGIIMLGVAIMMLTSFKKFLHRNPRILSSWTKTWMSSALKNKWSPLFVGLINGLLPCGLVYVALGGAFAMGTALNGALAMMAFGLGTIPVLLASGLLLTPLTKRFPGAMLRIAPWFVAIMAVMLILRGLDLGIHLVSPILGEYGQSGCH